jgi:hypothetical protein
MAKATTCRAMPSISRPLSPARGEYQNIGELSVMKTSWLVMPRF